MLEPDRRSFYVAGIILILPCSDEWHVHLRNGDMFGEIPALLSTRGALADRPANLMIAVRLRSRLAVRCRNRIIATTLGFVWMMIAHLGNYTKVTSVYEA